MIWYPRALPTACAESDLELCTSNGRGTIYSYSVVRQSYHPFFRNLVPYAVAYVDLDEGFRTDLEWEVMMMGYYDRQVYLQRYAPG